MRKMIVNGLILIMLVIGSLFLNYSSDVVYGESYSDSTDITPGFSIDDFGAPPSELVISCDSVKAIGKIWLSYYKSIQRIRYVESLGTTLMKDGSMIFVISVNPGPDIIIDRREYPNYIEGIPVYVYDTRGIILPLVNPKCK